LASSSSYLISSLTNAATDFSVVRDVFSRIAPIELAFRDQPKDMVPVFEDIRQTTLCISTRGTEEEEKFQLLQEGISSLQLFTIGSRHVIEDAMVNASKAALLATMIEKVWKSSFPILRCVIIFPIFDWMNPFR
jgi:hypothetical protein